MAEAKNYYIKVPGALVEVTEEVYLSYFRMKRRWSAQVERDTYNGLISYDAMDTEETLGKEAIPDSDSPSVEDAALEKMLRAKLRYCLPIRQILGCLLLPSVEIFKIFARFFKPRRMLLQMELSTTFSARAISVLLLPRM